MGDTVNNTAIGSALIIPDGLLNNLTKVDKKIRDIQDTSRATANVFNNSFASMSMGLKTGILTQLQQVINQLGSVGQAAQTASSATQNMGSGLGTAAQGATNLGTSVTGVVEAINRMIGQLQQTGQVGSSSLMAAKLAADKLMEAMQFKNTGNIAAIKDEIQNINKTLKDTESALSRSEQQTLVERKRLLQEELKEAERTQNERAVNLQRVLDRMVSAEKRYQNVTQNMSLKEAKSKEIQSKINLINERTATNTERANLEVAKQAKLQAKAATEAARLARAQAQLAQAQAMAATATDRANAANERAARRATISQYSQSASSALGYAGNSANVATFNQRATAMKVLEAAMKNLNKEDANYRKNLAELSARYKQLKADQDQLISSYRNIQTSHRKLMDTAGQLQRAFALMFSVSQIRGYIDTIAKVRGEFELQQRSLEAILQNKTEADAIFNKTVALAVQSPFQIRELVSYTKQLAAYRIESDKLYDTTKRLADVSAGLGVDMQRLILAYGQVKAAAYLRGCLGYNTPIRMYDGSIKMVQDVHVGDVLINENGDKVNVKELIRGREKMYIINQLCGNDMTMYKVNANHILTLWNVAEQRLEDIYLSDYLKDTEQPYLGVKVQDNGERFYYAIEAIECGVDNYYGFVLDGNKRFLLGDGTITHNTEVRQFTEAGINLYGELQRHFQEVKGEAYTTAQIVDMISKRMVTFEDVEQIFKRITDHGGIFYRMQEIQAETLQGKIANFKDSVDVMMNEIGKDNEGLFKGAIDSATALLGHWESVVNVGKTLVGVFILLKTQSMLTGVAMSKVFTAEFAAASTKNATALTLMKNGFASAGVAAANFGRSLKAAFMTNLPLAGFMIASEIVLNLINRQNEYSKSVRETVTEYNKSIYALKELKAAYSDTANASDNASKKELSNAENKREALEKLVEMMKKENLTIEFNVKDVSNSELEKYFKDSLQRYEKFLQGKKKLDILYEKNIRDTYVVDNVEDDLKDYSDAVSDLIAESDKIWEAIANLNAKYKELPESARIAFDELEKIKADDTNIDNIEERIKKLQVIYDNLRYFDLDTNKYRAKSGFENEAAQLNGLIRLYQKAQSAKEELLTVKKVDNRYIYSGELATIASELQKQYVEAIDKGVESGLSKAQARIQAAKDIQLQISTLQARKEIDDFGAEILKTAGDYKFVLYFDKKKAEDDVYSIKKQLDSAFANNVYTISFKLAKLDSDLGYDELDKQMQAKLKDLQKLVTQRHNLEGGNYAGYDPIAQNARINELYNDITHMGKGYKEAADHIMGYDNANKASAKSAKAQSDILSEQISLLKEMQKRYEDLQSVMGKNDAIQSVLQYYSASMQNVKMPKSIVNSFVPTKEGLINALENLLPTINDLKNEMDVRNTIAELKVQIDKENLKTDLDKVKKEINAMFKGLDLHQKLKDAGLTEEEVKQLFPGLAKSLDDVQAGIEERYKKNFPKGEYLKEGTDANEQYIKDIQELNDKRVKEQEDLVIELTKKYKTQLSEQLQLDKWYAEERAKIELANLTPEQKEQYRANLKKDYDKKTDENTWKNFKESDEYIKIFENLDYTSTSALNNIREKLEGMKDSLKNLPPDQLKVIVELIEKLKGETLDRNPIKGISRALNDLKNAKPEDRQKAIADLGATFETASSKIQSFNSAFGEVSSMLSSFGINVPEEISVALSGMYQAFSGASEFSTGLSTMNPLQMITGGLKGIAGIGKAIGSIFGFGNKDKKLQKEIEKQAIVITRLQRAYDKLKTSMDEAWSASSVIQANEETKENIEQQIDAYEKMIKAEEDKKKTDHGKIEEWENQIEELEKTLKELEEQTIEAFGGFGSEANYKSAAQEFSDAWVDAFNETEDTLKALNDTFDNYFNNMLKKQLMQRAAQKYLQPIFDAFDKAVSEGSAGGDKGRDVTKEEIAEIQRLKDAQLKSFDEYAKALMEVLGVKPSGTTGELSKLQQGIQNITESTGQALESLLNSIRFFVAQQTTDISAIRALLQQSSSIDILNTYDTPMLTELRTQTSYLRDILNVIRSVIRNGHPMGGAGIKVLYG